MRRLGTLARKYWFDVVIVLLAIEAMLEVSVRHGARNAPRTTLWFDVPALAIIMVLPLFARRRYPFAAPAAYWLLATAVSFVDGRLVTFMTSVFVLGMAAAFLLGNLRDAVKARIGLADRRRLCGDRRLQRPRSLGQRARLHPAPVRDLLARRLCAARAGT